MSRTVLLGAAMAMAVSGQTCVPTTTALSQVQADAMLVELNAAFVIPVMRGRVPPTGGDVVGGVVRLAFHDAAGFDRRAADALGVDGCVDLNNPDNAGLADTIALLNELHQPHCDVISRSDYWVLAAKVRQLRHHFWTIFRAFLSSAPPPRTVGRVLLGAQAYLMLIGACNPMLCPIRGFRPPLS